MIPAMVRTLLFFFTAVSLSAEPARIHVFVALADNRSQGIVPVPAKIGDGDRTESNLYWGCSEALKPVLRASGEWKIGGSQPSPKPEVLERAVFTHRSGRWILTADAYRGSAIRECTTDFFAALASDEPLERLPLVAYIGHDGLMDFALPPGATARQGPGRQAIVLCCKSAEFFGPHLDAVNARPLLLTTQLMYPGGFILHAALDGWIRGESAAAIHHRAAVAYARNQRISLKAARGVFVSTERNRRK